MFDDAWPHEVANPSREPRVVWIVDAPLPAFPNLVNRAVLGSLTAPLYGRRVVRLAEQYSGDFF